VKTHQEIKNTLRRHFDKINSLNRFKGCTKVFIPENNLGNEATHMENMIKNRQDVKTYWQTEKRPGVNKDQKKTDLYQYLLDSKLRNSDILFDAQCFTTGTKRSLDQTKSLLREQMEIYHYESNPNGTSQKLTGKQGHKQDDLLIALMTALYYGRASGKDPRRLQ